MIRIGVTGHMNLSPETVDLVDVAIRRFLGTYVAEGLTGVSCLAAGADCIFAEAVLDLGGDLEVVLPSADYRRRQVRPDHAGQFDSLVARARQVRVMPYPSANRAAYEAANEAMLADCDMLVAVWDGRPPVDQGGTAAAVEQARGRGMKVEILWPATAARLGCRSPLRRDQRDLRQSIAPLPSPVQLPLFQRSEDAGDVGRRATPSLAELAPAVQLMPAASTAARISSCRLAARVGPASQVGTFASGRTRWPSLDLKVIFEAWQAGNGPNDRDGVRRR